MAPLKDFSFFPVIEELFYRQAYTCGRGELGMPERKFLVRAGFHNRIGCPISIHTELPEDVRGAKLQELGSGREVPCQIDIVEGRARRESIGLARPKWGRHPCKRGL
jgi:hypothetical protein